MLLMKVSKYWKIVEFRKIPIKTKNCKTFYDTQTARRLEEIIQPSSPLPPQLSISPDKILLRLRNKNFLREINRNIQTFAFKVLQESSSWPSGNGAVQIFFLTPNRNIFAGKFVNRESFLTLLCVSVSSKLTWSWINSNWFHDIQAPKTSILCFCKNKILIVWLFTPYKPRKYCSPINASFHQSLFLWSGVTCIIVFLNLKVSQEY